MGLVMAIGTLVMIYRQEGMGSVEHARTMGLTTFSIFNLLFALEAADERVSVFSGQILRNATLLKTTLLSAVAIILATELRIFNSILATTPLSAAEWATCLGVAASIIVVAEVWKLILRRRSERPAASPVGSEGAAKRPTRPVPSGG